MNTADVFDTAVRKLMTLIPSSLWAEPACLLLTKVGDDASVNKVAELDTEVIITDIALFTVFGNME